MLFKRKESHTVVQTVLKRRSKSDFLGRPYVSTGRPYVLLQMFFFLSPRNRAPSADRRETLPHDRNMDHLYNVSPKIRGPSP